MAFVGRGQRYYEGRVRSAGDYYKYLADRRQRPTGGDPLGRATGQRHNRATRGAANGQYNSRVQSLLRAFEDRQRLLNRGTGTAMRQGPLGALRATDVGRGEIARNRQYRSDMDRGPQPRVGPDGAPRPLTRLEATRRARRLRQMQKMQGQYEFQGDEAKSFVDSGQYSPGMLEFIRARGTIGIPDPVTGQTRHVTADRQYQTRGEASQMRGYFNRMNYGAGNPSAEYGKRFADEQEKLRQESLGYMGQSGDPTDEQYGQMRQRIDRQRQLGGWAKEFDEVGTNLDDPRQNSLAGLSKEQYLMMRYLQDDKGAGAGRKEFGNYLDLQNRYQGNYEAGSAEHQKLLRRTDQLQTRDDGQYWRDPGRGERGDVDEKMWARQNKRDGYLRQDPRERYLQGQRGKADTRDQEGYDLWKRGQEASAWGVESEANVREMDVVGKMLGGIKDPKSRKLFMKLAERYFGKGKGGKGIDFKGVAKGAGKASGWRGSGPGKNFRDEAGFSRDAKTRWYHDDKKTVGRHLSNIQTTLDNLTSEELGKWGDDIRRDVQSLYDQLQGYWGDNNDWPRIQMKLRGLLGAVNRGSPPR